jgi:predicted nucleic acid-binding protein
LVYSRVYLDSCILIAAFGNDTAEPVAEPLLEMIGSVGPADTPPFVTSELTLAESLVRAVREKDQDRLRSLENILTSNAWLDVAPISREILWGAAALRAWYAHLKLPDAIHIASAIASDCPHFLTDDQGIRGLYEVQSMRPGHPLVPRQTETIRPDRTTLEALVTWLRT